MSLVVSGATIIDGVAASPIEGRSIWIEAGRIRAIGRHQDIGVAADATVIDARGKFVIPGLMNGNVHLFCEFRLENLARYLGRYRELIVEAAQVALKNGVTTVFDTWGPRRSLMEARDRINAGATIGSRIFCAGNIIGFDGPISPDFAARAAEVASPAFTDRINAIFVENVGRHLMWLSPDEVASEVRTYIGKGVDFVKYACNEHFGGSAGAFLAFSPRVQAAIVEQAHRAGLTAQAHTMSVEGLRIATEAGCNIIQHANHTGPVAIPDSTLELMARRKTAAVVFPQTQRRLDWLATNESYRTRAMWKALDINVRNLIRSGVPLLLATDGVVLAPETLSDPRFESGWGGPWVDSLFNLATGHFTWLEAMEEKGGAPMEMLKAATLNLAVAYGKAKDLGSLEPGKIADLLILDKNPLLAAENYRSIHTILKDGVPVDRDALPDNPILGRPMERAAEEESYVRFLDAGHPLPMCGCMQG